MTIPTLTDTAVARARVTGPAREAVPALAQALTDGLGGATAAVVVYFASAAYDPADLAGPLTARFPGAAVIGCSTAGEFTDQATGTGGISAVALPAGVVGFVAAQMADLSQDAAESTGGAVRRIEERLGRPLRELDPQRYLGVVLIDGMHGAEETVYERLGNTAPLLNVVGGSAGDDLGFHHTWVAVGDRVSSQGLALLVVELGVPFRIVKSSSFHPAPGAPLRVTKADLPSRTVLEFDGRPAAQVYAEAVGVAVEELGPAVWLDHPVGLMIEGEPWIRSPQAVVAGGGIRFHARLPVGAQVHLMDPGDLVGETAAAVAAARAQLGGRARGALWFDCILRRLELDSRGLGEPFVAALGGIPSAGFHSYGECWLGHVNQTLTGVVLG